MFNLSQSCTSDRLQLTNCEVIVFQLTHSCVRKIKAKDLSNYWRKYIKMQVSKEPTVPWVTHQCFRSRSPLHIYLFPMDYSFDNLEQTEEGRTFSFSSKTNHSVTIKSETATSFVFNNNPNHDPIFFFNEHFKKYSNLICYWLHRMSQNFVMRKWTKSERSIINKPTTLTTQLQIA